MELEDKIQRIVENAKYCGLHSREATRQILLLLDVLGRSEQLPPNPITDEEHKELKKAIYPKDKSKRFRR